MKNTWQVSTHLCPTRTAQDLLDAVIVDCKVTKFTPSICNFQPYKGSTLLICTQVLNHKNQDIRPPAPSSTGGEVSTEQVIDHHLGHLGHCLGCHLCHHISHLLISLYIFSISIIVSSVFILQISFL